MAFLGRVRFAVRVTLGRAVLVVVVLRARDFVAVGAVSVVVFVFRFGLTVTFFRAESARFARGFLAVGAEERVDITSIVPYFKTKQSPVCPQINNKEMTPTATSGE